MHKHPLNALWKKIIGNYLRKVLKHGVLRTIPEWDAPGRKTMLVVHFVPIWALHLAMWVNCLPDISERKLWLKNCLRGTAAQVLGQIVRCSALDELDYPIDFPENEDGPRTLRIYLEDGDCKEIKVIGKRLTKVSNATKKSMLNCLKNKRTKQYWVGTHYWKPAVMGDKDVRPDEMADNV